MQIVRELGPLRDAIAEFRETGSSIGLVPTMGALHAGHMRLVEVARENCDHVVASIFVNPTQFGAGEDLDAYPRPEGEDQAKLEAAGVDLLWMPPVSEVYPDGFSTLVRVEKLSEGLCGANRPVHFDGVATVCTKLFNQVRPDAAYFGEKDWQQLAIIRRLSRDLDFTHEVVGVPTVREEDGLAMSSRNSYLSAGQRKTASSLPRIVNETAAKIAGGAAIAPVLDDGIVALIDAGFDKVDYLSLRDADTLEIADNLSAPARLFVAAHIGPSRLIDNIPVG